MHRRPMIPRGALLGAVVALLALAMSSVPAGTAAQTKTRQPPAGFRLMANAVHALQANRVECPVTSDGLICVANSSVSGGGFWPRGTPDQYIFASGLQMAGIVGADGGPWAGDTTGGFFFDSKGTTIHGTALTSIRDSRISGDTANWPSEALVHGPPYDPSLLGRQAASDQDLWWVMWEGDTSRMAGRRHPLGVLTEGRTLGWSTPSGNEDLVYFVFTFYNITSLNPASYSGVNPAIRPLLLRQAQQFHQSNDAKFGITLPSAGYTITSFFPALSADMDVANSGTNYSSVNPSFALGYTFDHSFPSVPGWIFDPVVFGPPLFAAAGFAGIKFLGGSPGAGTLGMYSNMTSGFGDPQNASQLYRFLSGNFSPLAGDPPCNTGNPLVTRICYVNNTAPSDMRMYQSTGPFTLAPGEAVTVGVAYIFAAPASTGLCPAACPTGNPGLVRPGSPTRLEDAVTLQAGGANPVDSLTGFAGYSDLNGDGRVSQEEFRVVPRSMLAKARVAQAFFDNGFVTPTAPQPPAFFLIPGDNRVTVMWRPSASEKASDPYFALASTAATVQNGSLAPNPLYDPNYRQFDVEGYRIYRGRTSSPGSLTLVAQYDYTGTSMADYTGQLNPDRLCAPELGITTRCPVAFDPAVPGVAFQTHVDYPLAGALIQVKLGERIPLTDGSALVLRADTVKGGAGATLCSSLCDTGVPFVFVDSTVHSNFGYFYAVTAFDVNSLQSGPGSMESPRLVKAVTPEAPASNHLNTFSLVSHVVGRGVAMDTIIHSDPAIDSLTGMFSGPARPADGVSLALLGPLVHQVLQGSGRLEFRLDSVEPGQADLTTCCSGVGAGVPARHFITVTSSGHSVSLIVPEMSVEGFSSSATTLHLTGFHPDPAFTARFGGDSAFTQAVDATIQPSVIDAGPAWGLGCRFGTLPGAFSTTDCLYNGIRWFEGPTGATSSPNPAARELSETRADPNGGNCPFNFGNSPVCLTVSFNNGGALTGVDTIFVPQSYTQLNRVWRNVESVLATVFRAADINVYWGAAGKVDSVIDLTHNVPIPFSPRIGASWGVVTDANTGGAGSSDTRPSVLTANDFACVSPMGSGAGGLTNPNLQYPCTGDALMTTSATLGPIAFYKDAPVFASTAPVSGLGFGLYVAGTFTMFQMPALPRAGTVWTLRTYAGGIRGGQGIGGGSLGSRYSFVGSTRPFTATGAAAILQYDVVNKLVAPLKADLSLVHTVPDPYYFGHGAFEQGQGPDNHVIKFVNLPNDAIIRIYSSSGVLVSLLEHHSTTFGGSENWSVTNRDGRPVASGVYFYHVEAQDARRAGRFVVVNLQN